MNQDNVNYIFQRTTFYIQITIHRKQRYCKQKALPGYSYCSHHQMETKNRKRIPCPLDPSHTVFEDLLKQHLFKCNAKFFKQMESQPYFKKGINSNCCEQETTKMDHKNLSKCSSFLQEKLKHTKKEYFDSLVKKLNNSYKKVIPEIQSSILKPEICSIFFKEDEKSKQKHVAQQASIIGHIEQCKLLQPNITWMEFGAGKGELTLMLHDVLYQMWTSRKNKKQKKEETEKEEMNEDNSKFILIDRKNFRRKMDIFMRIDQEERRLRPEEKVVKKRRRSRMENADLNQKVVRLQIDISHLYLGGLDPIKGNNCVVISKHLCGVATDLTLRCLTKSNYCKDDKTKG